MNTLKHILNGVIWLLVGLIVALMILTHVPPIQRFVGSQVSDAIAKKLGTKVNVERVDLGFFNRIIVDGVEICDQQGKSMLKATRLSAKFDYLALTEGRISISSAQLFGLQANLYKATADATPNFQFVLDSLASKDTTSHKPLDLAIHSLIIRNGNIRYDQHDIPTPSRFTPQHLHLTDVSTHIMLNSLKDDSLNLFVKKLSFKERAGLEIKSLSFSVIADKQHGRLDDFCLQLPHSTLNIPSIRATYQSRDKKIDMGTLQFEGNIAPSSITPYDLNCFIGSLDKMDTPVNLYASFHGTGTLATVSKLNISTCQDKISLNAHGMVSQWNTQPHWKFYIDGLKAEADGIEDIADKLQPQISIPAPILRIGSIKLTGEVSGHDQALVAHGKISADAGDLSLQIQRDGARINGHIETKEVNLERILDDTHFGMITTTLDIQATLKGTKPEQMTAKGLVARFDYNTYPYSNIAIDGKLANQLFSGSVNMDDPNGQIVFNGTVNLAKGKETANLLLGVRHLNPSALKLSNQWPGASFDFDLQADLQGNSINTVCGALALTDFRMRGGEEDFVLESLTAKADHEGKARTLTIDSDFGHVQIDGSYDYTTIAQSITNLIGTKLPTLPGLPKTNKEIHNDFAIEANIHKSDWLNHLLGIPLQLSRPLQMKGSIDDHTHQMTMVVDMPSFAYAGKQYRHGHLRMTAPGDTLKAYAHLQQTTDGALGTYWNVQATAADNKLHTFLSFENNNKHGFSGQLDTETRFYNDERGAAAHIAIQPSEITIGDTIWNVKPADIHYSKDHVAIHNFTIEHNRQHIIVSGNATKDAQDTVTVDLQDVDVSYILNLVNFHAVEFSGKATGYAYIAGAFDNPDASADLLVTNFKFEEGRMGVLSANVKLNKADEQLDIDAIAYDEDNARTVIKGYVSPKRNYIDLGIDAIHTRGEFLGSFCGSFMRDINLRADGHVRVFGDLKDINLEGKAKINGTVGIKPLNTTYTLRDASLTMIPDEIKIDNDSIFDRNGNYGIVSGSLYHKHLTRLTYDIRVDAYNLLSYDTKDYGDDTFFGTVFATGRCGIRGKSGEVTIDAHLTPEQGSFIEYNAASPDAISNQAFIHWTDRNAKPNTANEESEGIQAENILADIPSDIHMNLLINCTPQATLRVLMDKQSGDYIALNGNGTIRATYFNKGSFDMFGTYEVDHGIYKLTIQNVIRRDFQFQPGGTIGFGGDAMDANLNLKAQYAINGVSLSDLNIGRSFTSNNIRVNCLMNITGTPRAPRVDFGIDLPTISNDARQMVTNLINSEEEMNQQVLYLLAVGRFYSQGNNNATQDGGTQQSRTSLAMQSILSGTLSQQLSNVLSSVTHSSNWNLGANISTGDEGWNNAEYEGLLSGRLLNNRLLINGQFGYRDNANATTSFIGDFDLRYLIFPNGNFSVRVYNQTNDRYFTRNSLNTQGVGLILKKDFNGWRDLFGIVKKKKTKKTQKAKKDKKGKNYSAR